MNRLFSALCMVLLCSTLVFAIPAKRTVFLVEQPDGTTLSVSLKGDETYHYFTTTDGIPLVQKPDGSYYYALWSADTLTASILMAHDAGMRSAAEESFLQAQGNEVIERVQATHRARLTARNEVRAHRSPSRFASPHRVGESTGITGERKGLVILVNFSDVKFKVSAPQATFDDMMNTVGYKENGQYGSVHDYFLAQSDGKFSLTFDVVGPVQLSHIMSYYGADSGGEGNDVRPGAMVAEACKLADSQVDFSDYDWDGDGIVEQVYVIYAGYGQAAGASSSTIWPHEWSLYSSDYDNVLPLDGVIINTYACGSELKGRSGTTVDGIGTTCHEFSHCLGLPDFYDTEGSNFGMADWSIMDFGCYNDDGNCPAGYTAYEKMYSGWLTPVELSSPSRITGLQPVEAGGEAYIIYNDGNRDEYYLLENIQQEGWNTYAPGHGLMVLHVDYDANVWSNNEVNNTSSHQRMTIIPADGTYSTKLSSLAGDLYPGTNGNTSLTDTSSPAAKLFNLNADGRRYMGKPIEHIAESADGLVAFDFMGGIAIDAPTALPATHVSASGFTANWSAVPEATSYTLRLTTYAADANATETVLSDDFSKFVTSSAGTQDVASSIDDYTAVPGWEGYKLFTSSRGIKMGSSSYDGYLITPLLKAGAVGDVTVSLRTLSYNSTAPLFIVTLLSEAGEELQEKQFYAPTTESADKEITFSDAPAAFRLRIDSRKRSYLSRISVAASASSTTTEIQEITSTGHALTNLSGTRFSYVVRAVTPEGTSPWSNAIEVDLVTGVSNATIDNFAADEEVEVYTLTGRQLRHTRFAEWSRGLPPGIYLLRGECGVRKLQIK